MPYIGKQPDFNTVGTDELTDNAVTNAKIVDDISFTSITGSVVSASTAIVAGVYSGGVMSGSAQTAINLPRGVVSSSAQLMSGSVQTAENLPTNTLSGSMGEFITGSFSGSATSTGSFAHILVGGADGSNVFAVISGSGAAGTPGKVRISGSLQSTGSFGALAVAGKVTTHLLPTADDTYDLGSATFQWRDIYTGDFHLNNTSREEGNVIDGTTGNWTIQEGREDLYLLNNETGKKFKFKLEEIE